MRHRSELVAARWDRPQVPGDPGAEVAQATRGRARVSHPRVGALPRHLEQHTSRASQCGLHTFRERGHPDGLGGGAALTAALEFPKTPPLYGLTLQGSPDERHGSEATPHAWTEPEDLVEGIRSKVVAAKLLASSVRATGSALAFRVHSKADLACQRCFGFGTRLPALLWVVCFGPLLFPLFHIASTTIPLELSESGRAWSWAMGPARLERLLSRTLGLDTFLIAS